jgi:hypothetical protein
MAQRSCMADSPTRLMAGCDQHRMFNKVLTVIVDTWQVR